ncbi:MAG: hypothetical protein SH808_01660 [Saprospiraceae bacterium]|nr:hypothetical protein [Saprospiraceae bacterium]
MVGSPTNYYLHTQDHEDDASLWIEPGHMTFDASSATDFKHAIITGSQTHAEAKTFLEAIAAIESDDDMDETERLAMDFIKAYPAGKRKRTGKGS